MVNMNGPVKMASYDMAGKTAVVTGGTKGIGKAIALAFGQCGANVVVAGRHEYECTAVAEAITSAGGHGKGIRLHNHVESSTSRSRIFFVIATPAQLIRISTPPKVSAAPAIRASISSILLLLAA